MKKEICEMRKSMRSKISTSPAQSYLTVRLDSFLNGLGGFRELAAVPRAWPKHAMEGEMEG